MKRELIRTIYIALLTLPAVVFGQDRNTLAKMEYEKAEVAYNENRYGSAIASLQRAEDFLGSGNAKILYLRILTQKALLEEDPWLDFGFIQEIRMNCGYYLENYTNANEEKIKNIYQISKELAAYPVSEDDFRVAEEEERLKRYRIGRSLAIVDSLMRKHEFKVGLTTSEFRKYNTDAAAIMTSKNSWSYGSETGYSTPMSAYMETGVSSITISGGKVVKCTIALKTDRNNNAGFDETFDKYVHWIMANFEKEHIKQTFKGAQVASDSRYNSKFITIECPQRGVFITFQRTHAKKLSFLYIIFTQDKPSW